MRRELSAAVSGFLALTLLFPLRGFTETTSLDQQLLEATQFMDAAQVKQLLAKGANPNFDEGGRSVLGWAAQNPSVEIVEALLNAKANPNVYDGVGHTPLMRAIETQQEKNVLALLKAKADVNLKTKDGESTLNMAVESRKPEIVKAIIAAGADVKAVTPDGDSPALTAAQDGMEESLEIIKILGEAKANLDASNAAYTPLYYAVDQENLKLVQALLDAGADPNGKTEGGRVPLIEAVTNVELVKALLKAKADPNLANGSGETALFAAVTGGYAESVEALVAAGANVNAHDSYGNSVLQSANNYQQTSIAELLKSKGALE